MRLQAGYVGLQGGEEGAERPPESLSLNALPMRIVELSPPHEPYWSRCAVPKTSPEQSVQLAFAAYVCLSQWLHTPQASVTQPG